MFRSASKDEDKSVRGIDFKSYQEMVVAFDKLVAFTIKNSFFHKFPIVIGKSTVIQVFSNNYLNIYCGDEKLEIQLGKDGQWSVVSVPTYLRVCDLMLLDINQFLETNK